MNKIELGKDIKLLDIGNLYQISGLIFSGQGKSFITLLPHKQDDIFEPISLLPLTLQQMQDFNRQLDLLEVEMFARDSSGGLIKSIVRKTERQIDSVLQWACFERDSYKCRYCGRTGIPLSVDHIIFYEEMGPTIMDNLLTSCKSCNRDQGRVQYVDWIKSPVYLDKSKNLPESTKNANLAIALDIPRLEGLKVQNIRSR